MPNEGSRNKVAVAALLGIGVVFGLWWLLGARSPAGGGSAMPQASAAAVAPAWGPPPGASAGHAEAAPGAGLAGRRGKRVMGPEVERLRSRVIDSLAAPPAVGGAGAAITATTASTAAASKHGHLKDHTGELNPETLRVLNEELMPMVNECYEHARERNPQLRGMLALSVDLAGAEEVGTIIETVEPAPAGNELRDDELIECVRQSAFSMQLPLPLKSGRVARELTMRFGDDDSAASAPQK